MHAKLEGLEIPEKLIGSIIPGATGEVRIKGKAIKDTDRKLISEGFGRFAVGETLHIDAADSYGNRLKGVAEVRKIDLNQSTENYYSVLDFAISLKLV